MTIKEFIEKNAKKASEIEATEIEYFLKEWLPIPKSAVSMLTSAGGIGKTMLAIQIALRIVAENPDRKVLLWLTEDPEGQIKSRLNEITYNVFQADKNILDRIDIIGADAGSILITIEEEEALKEALLPYSLIIIDPLIAFYGYSDENNNRDVRQFMQVWNRTAIKNKQAIMILHHNDKGNNNARGASDFINAVRLLYKMEFIEDSKNRKITVEKENGKAKFHLGAVTVERLVMPAYIKVEKQEEKDEEY